MICLPVIIPHPISVQVRLWDFVSSYTSIILYKVDMNFCSKAVAFAILACGVAFAAVLQFDPLKMSEHLKSDMQGVMDLVMKPHKLSRFIPAEVYKSLGLDPSTRLMSYKWDNCGNKKTENFIINDIEFTPDPLSFPGTLSVSFSINLNVTITSALKGVVLLKKKVASSWIELPCIAQIGSCTYDDICPLLDNIGDCPPEFQEAGVPCKCPFNKGAYKLPKASFQVDASFLPTGDYQIRANLTHGDIDGGCYDIYASFA